MIRRTCEKSILEFIQSEDDGGTSTNSKEPLSEDSERSRSEFGDIEIELSIQDCSEGVPVDQEYAE